MSGTELHPHRRDDSRVCDQDLANTVVELLHGQSIATAESCTAGRIAQVLAAVPSAADFFRGGLVAYQEVVKRSLLEVAAPSVITARAASEMAAGARRLFAADVTVATTGVAGDEPEDGMPPGTVFIATLVGDTEVAERFHFAGSPEEVCDKARRAALEMLIDSLGGSG